MRVDEDEIESIEKNSKKKEKEIKPIHTSRLITGTTLYEEIYLQDRNKVYFLGWDAKNQKTLMQDNYKSGDDIFLPIKDDMLTNQAVILPSGTEEYGSIDALQKEIHDFIYKYVDVSEEHLQKVVWYVQLSWVLDNVHTVPYLRALGDYGSGKTRYEDVVGGICYKPMFVGGSVRSAPIYRVINQWRGTAVFDEFTLSKTDETLDIVQILNCGFQRGKPVLRCKDGNYSQVECFDPFGAKILASRKNFDDRALESRCITEIIKETDREDISIDLGEHFFSERAILQNKLLLYRFRYWDKIKHDESIKIEFGHIQPRIKQTFLPFTVLFETDKEVLDAFIATVKKSNEKMVEDNAATVEGHIINIYCELRGYDGGAIIAPQDIRNELVNKYGYNEERTRASTVGKRLPPLGFKSTPKKDHEGKTKRDITISQHDLKRLIYRYVLPERQDDYLKLTEKKLEEY